MNRRTCACGTPIVCADLDGYDVWLDVKPTENGLFRVAAYNGEHLGVEIDPAGHYQRHTCAADPEPIDLTLADTPWAEGRAPNLNLFNQQRVAAAAARDVAAAKAALAAGLHLSPLERAAAVARVDAPTASCSEIGITLGRRPDAVNNALLRVRKRARQLDQSAA